MDLLAYEIVEVGNNAPDRRSIYDQCIQVRIEVFVREQKFPLEVEVDEIDAFATHFLLRLVPSRTPVGTIRMHKPAAAKHYKLTRLAVLKEYRKHHLGAALVQRAHRFAAEDALKSGQAAPVEVVAHSQIPAKSFYARFGYFPEGNEFDEDDAPHQLMKVCLKLDASPITKAD